MSDLSKPQNSSNIVCVFLFVSTSCVFAQLLEQLLKFSSSQVLRSVDGKLAEDAVFFQFSDGVGILAANFRLARRGVGDPCGGTIPIAELGVSEDERHFFGMGRHRP